jgi:hypothetical protein
MVFHKPLSSDGRLIRHNIMAYFLKGRTVKPEKQPLLGNGCITRNNEVNVGRGVFCAVCRYVSPEAEERPLLEDVTQQRSKDRDWEH